MFQHLKIENFKAIKRATLLNLGKINVVCGKNNSGKSTILEGICPSESITPSNSFLGKTLKMNNLKSLDKIPTVWYPRNASSMSSIQSFEELDEQSGIKNFKDKYFKILEKVISNKGIWFANEGDNFSDEIENKSKSVVRKNIFEKVKVEIAEAFKNEFWDLIYNVIIVSPKRNLEQNCAYTGYKKKRILPDGDNLLSHLYWLKNQARNSEEYKFYDKLSKAFEKVSSGHKFNITRETSDELSLRFSLAEQDEIRAVDCGLGLQDLLVILFFAMSSEYQIVLIEEPENHIHPEMQRKLLRFLSEETEKQYFITTHSNIFLNNTYVDRIFYTEYKNGEIIVSDATSKANVLHNLGYSVTDNLVSDLIVLVEGSGDKSFLEEFFSKLGLDNKYNIKIWILGGDEMVNQDLSVFAQDYKIVALVDKDTQSEENRLEFEKNCKNYKIGFHKLKRYSIESYFSIKSIE